LDLKNWKFFKIKDMLRRLLLLVLFGILYFQIKKYLGIQISKGKTLETDLQDHHPLGGPRFSEMIDAQTDVTTTLSKKINIYVGVNS